MDESVNSGHNFEHFEHRPGDPVEVKILLSPKLHKLIESIVLSHEYGNTIEDFLVWAFKDCSTHSTVKANSILVLRDSGYTDNEIRELWRDIAPKTSMEDAFALANQLNGLSHRKLRKR